MTRLRCPTFLLAALLLAAAALPARAGTGVPPGATRHARTEAEVATTYGIAALNEGKDGEAVKLLEEAVADDPQSGSAHYWLGFAYLRLGRPADALVELEAARRAREAPEVDPARLEEDIARARHGAGEATGVLEGHPRLPGKGEGESAPLVLPGLAGAAPPPGALPFFETQAGISVGHDSNPGLVPDGVVALVPGKPPITGPEADDAGDLDLRFEAHPFYDRSGFSLGIAAGGKATRYRDLSPLDLDQWRGVLSLAWGGDPLGYLVGPLGYSRVPVANGRFAALFQGGASYDLLDGKRFLRTTDANLTLTLREAAITATELDLAWQDRTYSQARRQLDGTTLSVGLAQYLYLGRRDRYLRLGVIGGRRDAGRAYDAKTEEATAELALPLAARWTLYLAGDGRREDFDHPESNPLFPSFLGSEKRRDTLYRATAALTWAATDHLYLTLRGATIDRNADLGQAEQLVSLDYRRDVVSLGARWFF